ncbi:MAG: damage-inducible protein CinA [Candidatus Pelagibacter sp.]|nr:damage-inducible protein CinA [Candidatus Pelagibacter sp.]|tara:strand:- start:3407 stop:3874 length:468 start_codon:yes stop_codon:yes gene_type:complete
MNNNSLIRKLINNKISISVAESCTGGLLASEITSVSGCSKIFNSGFVTYSNTAKVKFLRVKKKTLKKNGAVSPETCKEMVENLYKLSKSKLCISTTGIAGPSGGTSTKPIGLVYVGIKFKKKTKIFKFNFSKKLKRKMIQINTVNKIFKICKNLL